ncbi:uncharacterized protein LOC120271947 isoform X2 [Dioscorea cayenensis subsp. rotundata]|nr:uncharacterized protein LOC120271947 isoform X2 [Dioscorea cayenensis subsp. rotundata]
MDHGMTELVFDFRREYATKLEQSQERARRLQKDLAIEEQHGQHLSEILKKIVPDTKSSQTVKSRARRKEPPPISAFSATPMDNGRSSSSENLSSSTSKFSNNHLDHHEESDDQTQCSLNFAKSECALSGICSGRKFSDPMLSNDYQIGQKDSDTPRSGTSQFSFRHK